MDWIERLNESMHYIEEHLTDKIDYDQLGRKMQRMPQMRKARLTRKEQKAGKYRKPLPTAC